MSETGNAAERPVTEAVSVFSAATCLHFASGQQFGVLGIQKLSPSHRMREAKQIFHRAVTATCRTAAIGQRACVAPPDVRCCNFSRAGLLANAPVANRTAP